MQLFAWFLLLLGLIRNLAAETTDAFLEDFVEEYTITSDAAEGTPILEIANYNSHLQETQGEANLIKESQPIRSKCIVSTFAGSNSGEIFSPNYPKPYPNNATCMWTIMAPKDHRIYLYFHYFDLEESLGNTRECHFDMLYIVEEILDVKSRQEDSGLTLQVNNLKSGDIPSTSEGRKIIWGLFCGKNTPPPRMTETYRSKLVLIFHSDESQTRRGFWASFHIARAKYSRNMVGGEHLSKKRSSIDRLDRSNWKEEEEDVKRAYLAIVLFIVSVLMVMIILHCWQRSTFWEMIRGCCSHARVSDSIPSVLMNGFGPSNADDNESQNTQDIPSPPPAYGELFKTEDDWERALERMGETRETMEIYRLNPRNIQIEYDILGGSHQIMPSNTASEVRGTLTPEAIVGAQENSTILQSSDQQVSLSNVERNDDDQDESDTRGINCDNSSLEKNTRPPFCSPLINHF